MEKLVKDMTIEELRARKTEIRRELENPDADLDALEKEALEITEREKQHEQEQRRKGIAQRVAEGEGEIIRNLPAEGKENEMRAKRFTETGRTAISAKETRAVLVSGGKLATPTEVTGINDKVGTKISSIVDLVKVENCNGMGKNRVAYLAEDADEANEQTEGAAADEKTPTFGYVDISPTSVAVLSQISKQAKKQSPLQYEAKVQEQALLSLAQESGQSNCGSIKEIWTQHYDRRKSNKWKRRGRCRDAEKDCPCIRR